MGKWLALALCVTLAGPATGQELTEKYIPVGQYLALRGPDTHHGRIVSVQPAPPAVTLATESGEQTYAVTAATFIWIDRSLQQETNLDGTLADVKPGMNAEVRVERDDPTQAYWIKVQLAP